MKIVLAILTSIFAVTASTLQAQECESNPVNFRINPFSIVADGISGGIDISLSKQMSLGLDGGYTYNTEITTGAKGKSYSGAMRLTYYSDSMSEDSFTSSISLGKNHLDFRTDENEKQIIQATIGDVKLGYRWIWDAFNTNIAGGIAQVRTSSNHLKTRGLTPVIELSLGYQI